MAHRAGCYLCRILRGREGFAAAVRRPGSEFTLQKHLLPAGVAPHSERGQVHGEVVSRLLHTKLLKIVNGHIRRKGEEKIVVIMYLRKAKKAHCYHYILLYLNTLGISLHNQHLVFAPLLSGIQIANLQLNKIYYSKLN